MAKNPAATLFVPVLKIDTNISPDAIPLDIVPPEPKPAGNPVLDVVLVDSGIKLRGALNGKAVRRALKVMAAHSPDGVFARLQGQIRPPAAPNEPYRLENAGLMITPKTPKAEPVADRVAAEGVTEPVTPSGAAEPAALPANQTVGTTTEVVEPAAAQPAAQEPAAARPADRPTPPATPLRAVLAASSRPAAAPTLELHLIIPSLRRGS